MGDAVGERASLLEQGALLFRLGLVALGLALAGIGVLLRRDALSHRPGTPTPPAGRRGVLAASGILVLAAVLRVVGLESGLWYDEIVALVRFVRLSTTDLLTTYTALNNHVLFSLLARGSVSLFGESAWALRLPAALFGVASVWGLWWFGAQVTSRREATLAALLLAVSYHHVWFSQNARGYTGLMLWNLVGTGLFVKGMRGGARGVWIGYAVVLALAMYTHLSAVFLFAGHGLVYLWIQARRWLVPVPAESRADPPGIWPLVGFLLGGLITFQLYAMLLPQVIDAFGAQAGEQSVNVKIHAWTNPWWTALEIVRGLELGLASTIGLVVAGMLGGVGLLSYARRDRLTTAVMLLPLPVTVLSLMAISFHIWPRYFFPCMGFGILLIMRGVFVIAAFVARRASSDDAAERRARLVATVLAGLMIVASALSLGPNYSLPKQDYLAARADVESMRAADEPVVTVGLVSLPYREYYATDWTAVADLEELDAIMARSGRVWLVYSFPTYMASVHPDILDRIQEDFEVVRTYPGTLADGTIFVCRR